MCACMVTGITKQQQKTKKKQNQHRIIDLFELERTLKGSLSPTALQ